MHPAGMHRPIVEAVLTGDPEASSIAMYKHTLEFGEILIKMEKAYREKNQPYHSKLTPLLVLFNDRYPRAQETVS